ncbi:hypothetical protein GGX14DRAFT_383282, partial [Mycena pura]
VKQYTQASAALRRMGMGAQWKPITKEDLKMPGDITETNRIGQRSSVLAWFWRLEDGEAVGEMAQIYRVNWLRAKARVARWEEEKKFVSNKMVWTVNSFKHEQNLCAEVANDSQLGLLTYAEKQADLWADFAVHAQRMFAWARGTPKKSKVASKGPKLHGNLVVLTTGYNVQI